jgi:hypothetical protein
VTRKREREGDKDMHATYKRSEIRTALKFFTARLKDRG